MCFEHHCAIYQLTEDDKHASIRLTLRSGALTLDYDNKNLYNFVQ